MKKILSGILVASLLAVGCTPTETADSGNGNSNEPVPYRDTSGKWGYQVGSGKTVIEPTFDAAMRFKDGLARVKTGGKTGFIGKDGSFKIEAKFDNGADFANGFAPVAVDGKWGFIDTEGKFKFEPEYSHAERFSAGGYAVVEKDGVFGYIDHEGIFTEGDTPEVIANEKAMSGALAEEEAMESEDPESEEE